jgi:type I restriction enzyme S subunit
MEKSFLKNIPEHWQVKKLGEVCFILDNLRKPINSSERQKRIVGKSNDKLFPYYGATGQVGWIDDFLTEGEFILIGEDGAPFLDIYKDKAYKIKGKTWVNNHAHILQGKEQFLINDFVLYYLNSINYREFVNGTTRLKLTKGNLVEIPFILPPLPEQQAIVARIGELFSKLENGKNQLLKVQKQLKVYRQSLLKWAFEGKLTNKDLVNGELPKGWKWVKIDYYLSDVKKGMGTGPFGTMLKKNEHKLAGVPVLGIENIGEGSFRMPNKIFITQNKAIELKNFKVKENDVIISRSGTVGEICLIPKQMEGSIISTNLIKVTLNQEKINPKFFVFLFQGGKVRQQVFDLCKGSSRAFLNQTILKALDFPYCPIGEQQKIVDELESKLSICEKIEDTINQNLLKVETLRQSILKNAFEGKLV